MCRLKRKSLPTCMELRGIGNHCLCNRGGKGNFLKVDVLMSAPGRRSFLPQTECHPWFLEWHICYTPCLRNSWIYILMPSSGKSKFAIDRIHSSALFCSTVHSSNGNPHICGLGIQMHTMTAVPPLEPLCAKHFSRPRVVGSSLLFIPQGL